MAGFDLSAMLKDVPKSGTIPELRLIPFDKIEPDPRNGYSMDGIEELAGNIETVGLLDPLVVLPETDGVYPLLSGHRRHAAIDRIINGGNEMFSKGVPCIVRANREPQEGEDPQVTQLLNRLTLLMANSDNRKKTSADDMREAEGLEEIVAKLADLGFEFPGRRRDWVAKLTGMSKSKLARLKVIKDKLEPSIKKAYYDKGKLKEDSAYKLAQLPPEVQRRTVDWFRIRDEKPQYWYASTIEGYGEDILRFAEYKCPKQYGGGTCSNQENLQARVWKSGYHSYCHCSYAAKCCATCADIASCSYVCEHLKPKADKLRAEKRAQNKAMKEAEKKAERPFADRVRALWLRFGNALDRANMETEQLWKITGNKIYQLRSDEITALERGEYAGKVKSGTVLPYANNSYLSDVDRYIKAAEALGCSLDYLFLRTDVPEINTGEPPKQEISVKFLGWLTGTPPDGVKCWAKFMDEETSRDFSMMATYDAEMDVWWSGANIGKYSTIDQTCIGWWPFPEDNAPDIPGDLTPIDPAPKAWQTGKPSRPGLYAVRFKAGLNAPGEIHNFAKWDGFQWHAERSGRVIDDMIAVGWSPLPEVEE